MPGRDVLSTAPAALVLGDAQVGKRALLSRLPHLLFGGSKEAASLAVETKYYSATVRVQVAGGGYAVPPAGCEWEAVVLVFDSTNEASFNFVKQWAASGEATDAEIKLCIANKADRLLAGTSLERSAWLDAAADWCTRELYEYIEVSATNEGVDRQLELDGERQGVQRVQAALQAHMWPGLLLKNHPDTGERSDAGLPPNSTPVSTAAAPIAADGASLERPAGPNSASGEDSAATATAAGNGEHHQGDEGVGEGGIAGVRTEKDIEQEVDRFEQVLSALAGTRGRLQGLSDSERRSAAEEMTLRLMADFDLEEEDSDASSDE